MQDKPRTVRRTASPTLLVVDDHPLTGKHIAGMIRARYRNARVLVAGHLDEVYGCAADLLIVNLNDRRAEDPAVLTLLEGVRRHFPGVPLTMLCGRSGHSVAPPGVRAMFELSLPADVLVAALRLVMAGGVYFHVNATMPENESAAAPAPLRRSADESVDHAAAVRGLTARERQVLQLLRQGRANKLIAHELRISENTVKVHVRRVMRKLNVTNRTQAAFIDGGDRDRAI